MGRFDEGGVFALSCRRDVPELVLGGDIESGSSELPRYTPAGAGKSFL